ncbi:ATP-binding protein [Kitasatospora sp. NPDC094015]|uniref:ATP-binding protein n=1 Tax=Kitasatospora sp. NPDC094015 TaxID=3155205 RepID=UPI00332FBC46
MISFDPAARRSGSAQAGADFIWLPRRRRSVGAARGLLRTFLGGVPGGDGLLAAGELVLSELATNAIEHASVPPGRLIAVRFEMVSAQLRLEVHDASRAWPTVRPLAGGYEESGRGLLLVESMAAGWGCCLRPGGVGKFVWAVVGPVEGES